MYFENWEKLKIVCYRFSIQQNYMSEIRNPNFGANFFKKIFFSLIK